MTILISTVGDISGYSAANYFDRSRSRMVRDSYMVLKWYTKYFNLRKIILVVLESVITSHRSFRNSLPDHISNMAKHPFDHLKVSVNSNSVSIEPSNINSYKEWVKVVNKYYEFFLNHMSLSRVPHEVIVLPARVNDLKGYSYDVQDIQIYRALLLHKLYESLKDIAEEEIILDITHGLNYIVAHVIDSLRLLIPLLGRNVSVYNAIPLNQPPKDFEVTEIYKLVRGKIDLNTIDESKISPYYKSILKSLFFNTPLSLYYLLHASKIREENYYEKWVEGRRVEAKKIYGGPFIKPDEVYMNILTKHISNNIGSNELREIQKWATKLYGLISESSKEVIAHELNSIYDMLIKECGGDRLRGNSIMLRELREQMGRRPPSENFEKEGASFRRNFMAHGGFLDKITLIRKEHDKFFLEYSDDGKNMIRQNLGINLQTNVSSTF